MSLMPVAEALRRVLEGVSPLSAEHVPLREAAGRVLAADLAANLTQPPFNASAMDGYAVRAQDVAHPPVTLAVLGEAAAGNAFAGRVEPGMAVRIFTGAPVPEGADAIVIQENTEREGASVTILKGAEAGTFVRRKGYDFSQAEVLLRAGVRLGARQLMLAAAMNHAALPVRRKPVVAILATGNELAPPGGEPRPDQIISSVPAGLHAAITVWGGEPLHLGIALDTVDSLADAIARARDADILLTIGGASTGDHDLVRQALLSAGMALDIWKIAMRPGKPLMFGHLGDQRVLGLPGNPVSAVICARVFLKPLLDTLLGRDEPDSAAALPLATPVQVNGEREHYMRGFIADGRVSALPDQDSSLMRLFAEANCLILRPAHASPAAAGEPVPVLPLDF